MRPRADRPYLLRGTTERCLADFAQRFPADKARPLLVEFASVDRTTVQAWLKNERLPGGEPMLRLRCFLDLTGYRVEELFLLPEVTRQFAKLIAFGILSLDTVRHELGYRNIQDVYRVLRGSGAMTDRVHRLERLVRDNRVSLEEKQAAWQARIQKDLFSAQDEAEPTTAEVEAEETPAAPDIDRLLVQALVNSMRTTHELGEAVAMSHHTGLRAARQSIEQDEVRRLIDILQRLLT